MDYLDIIQNQADEIKNMYSVLGDIMEDVEYNFDENEENEKMLNEFILISNKNTNLLTAKLERMDTDIFTINKTHAEYMDEKFRENNKKNGLYKSELTKKVNGFKNDLDKDLLQLKEDVGKNNSTEERMLEVEEKLTEYQKSVNLTFEALKRELRITRNMKIQKIKGLSIK